MTTCQHTVDNIGGNVFVCIRSTHDDNRHVMVNIDRLVDKARATLDRQDTMLYTLQVGLIFAAVIAFTAAVILIGGSMMGYR